MLRVNPPKAKPSIGKLSKFVQSLAMFNTPRSAWINVAGPAITLVPVSNAAWQPCRPQRCKLVMSMATSLMVACHMPMSTLESGRQRVSREPIRSSLTPPKVISESSSSPSIESHTAKRLLSKASASARFPKKLKCPSSDVPSLPKPRIPSYEKRPNGSSDISVAATSSVCVQRLSSGPRQTLSSSTSPVRPPAPTRTRTSPRPAALLPDAAVALAEAS
mmetsp:Transcript_109957/g.355063  ORF Transcript_109957/g.355063 Transcript_109957/m.355063 type:complete len:219 (+) Transcript_109957:622-1278(+)